MTPEQVAARCEYFNSVHGITRRAIAVFGDSDLSFRPAPGMRSPRELIFHVYTQAKLLADAARSGRMSMEAAEASDALRLRPRVTSDRWDRSTEHAGQRPLALIAR
jgi:hypothetical protein